MPKPTSTIASSIAAAREWLREHPDEARYTDSAASAAMTDGLHCRVTGVDGAELATDMPESVGGTASAPSPGWLLRAATASCVATLLTMRAASLGRQLRELAVTVDSVSDDRGILAVDDDVPAGPFSPRIVVQADGVDAPTLRELADWAVDHCPVSDATRRAVPLTVEVRSVDTGAAGSV